MARQVNVGTAKNEFKLCPVGRHVARVVKAEYRTTDGGKEMNEITFKVLDGPGAGCTMKETFWLTSDKTYERYDLFCAALGIKAGTSVDPNDPHSALVGRTIAIKVKHEDRDVNGQTYTDAKLAGFIGWEAVDKAKYPDTAPGENGHANPDPTGGDSSNAGGEEEDDPLPF